MHSIALLFELMVMVKLWQLLISGLVFRYYFLS